MKFPEEDRIEECPVAYAKFVRRVQNGERNFYRMMHNNKKSENEEFGRESDFDHLVSWMLLASVYYRNFGMLQDIISVIKEREKTGVTVQRQNRQTQAKLRPEQNLSNLIKVLSIGCGNPKQAEKKDSEEHNEPIPQTPVQEGNRRKRKKRKTKKAFTPSERKWYQYEKNLLFWSIMIKNDPEMTSFLLNNGVELNLSVLSLSDSKIPFNFLHLLRYNIQENINIFSLSLVGAQQHLKDKNACYQDQHKATEWLENRKKVIVLVLKFIAKKLTIEEFSLFNFQIQAFLSGLHEDHVSLKEKVHAITHFNSTKNHEIYRFPNCNTQQQIVDATARTLEALQTQTQAFGEINITLNSLWPNKDANELRVFLEALSELSENIGANLNFFSYLNKHHSELCAQYDHPSFYQKLNEVLTKNKQKIPSFFVSHKEKLIECLRELHNLPKETFHQLNLFILLNKISILKKAGVWRKDTFAVIFGVLMELRADVTTEDRDVVLTKIINSRLVNLKGEKSFLPNIKKYWDDAIKTFFFTKSAKTPMIPYLPVEIIRLIATFLNPGEIKFGIKNFVRRGLNRDYKSMEPTVSARKVEYKQNAQKRKREIKNEDSQEELTNSKTICTRPETPPPPPPQSDQSPLMSYQMIPQQLGMNGFVPNMNVIPSLPPISSPADDLSYVELIGCEGDAEEFVASVLNENVNDPSNFMSM